MRSINHLLEHLKKSVETGEPFFPQEHDIEMLERYTNTSTDLISRADAIEAVHEYFRAQLAESDGEWNNELQEYVFSKEDKRLLEHNKGVSTTLKTLPYKGGAE